MGISILELVLQRLRQANFAADIAYPGQKCPLLTEPAATVHLEKVDREKRTVTVEVSILCPAAFGGGACELEALRATEALRQAGAACVQQGCRYDNAAQVYAVTILASFTAVTGAHDCVMGPGFGVQLGGTDHPHVISFQSVQGAANDILNDREKLGLTDISLGKWVWKLEMEEQIPVGSGETAHPEAPFELKVTRDVQTEGYLNCYWTSVKREYSQNGLRKILMGFAINRQIA